MGDGSQAGRCDGRPVLLSATLIVRNEAGFLPECLSSIAPVVDEIVVVDTGSTDGSDAIARDAGARVFSHPWDGRFDAPRNAALDHARGDWILYIDADERLAATDDLRDRLASTTAIAGLVRFRPMQRLTRYWECRLFRHRADIRFRGGIHETVLPDIGRLVAAGGGAVTETPAEIDHLGYEGDQEDKHRRNLPLLERQVREEPDRIYLWHHLGHVRQSLGDEAGAEAAWAQAVSGARRLGDHGPLGLLARADLALRRLRAGQDAADLVAELRAYYPDDPLATWIVAQDAISRRRWRDAAVLLKRLWATDATVVTPGGLAYDERMFGESTAAGLGTCAFQLGDDIAAERWFARAVRAAPDVVEYGVKRQLAASRAATREAAPSGS
jgi:glycosyltransferase involved in cell wall biosynthesis